MWIKDGIHLERFKNDLRIDPVLNIQVQSELLSLKPHFLICFMCYLIFLSTGML